MCIWLFNLLGILCYIALSFGDKNFLKFSLVQNKLCLLITKDFCHGDSWINYTCSSRPLKCQVMKLINHIFIIQANYLFLFI